MTVKVQIFCVSGLSEQQGKRLPTGHGLLEIAGVRAHVSSRVDNETYAIFYNLF